MCCDFPQKILSETFLVLIRIHPDFIIKVLRSSCQVRAILVGVLIKLEFSPRILEKKPQISNFMKNHPVGEDGQRDGHIHDNGNSERIGKR